MKIFGFSIVSLLVILLIGMILQAKFSGNPLSKYVVAKV